MTDLTDEPTTPPLAFAITGGGTPTAAQVAALAVALTPTAADPEPATDPRGTGWQRAALMEGVGHRIFVSADDVVFGRRRLG